MVITAPLIGTAWEFLVGCPPIGPTPTQTSTPSNTPSNTSTQTQTPTNTPTNTQTPGGSPTPTITETPKVVVIKKQIVKKDTVYVEKE